MFKAFAIASLLAISPAFTQAVHAAQVPDQHWSLLAGRLFPTLENLELTDGGTPSKDPAIVQILKNRWARIGACNHLAPCILNASLWDNQEIDAVGSYAERILGARIAGSVSSDDGVKARVGRELQGINGILKVYGLGATPTYPLIDGPTEMPGSPEFNVMVADAVLLGEGGADDPVSALDPSIGTALALLDVNNRNDAVAFEPLEKTYNALAAAKARTIDWARYRYTAIIVPGKGPEDLMTPLSARGKLRIRLAAEQFAEGVAPFIIVSGAAVHPKGAKFVEAIEMRDALIERYGISADCIIVEPYARHTNTNLRNATRLLFSMGAPLDRDTLVVTDADQNDTIQSQAFAQLNQDHLGYQPGTVGTRLSPTELVFRPSVLSLRLSPADPLDP